ncbi:nuclear transport factor 2 family protein [Thermincola ferriacetica]
MNSNTFNKKGLLISIAIVTIAGLMIWASLGFVDKDEAKDIAEIEKVITKGVHTFNSLDIAPAPYNSVFDKAPDDVKNKMNDKFVAELSKYYSGPLLNDRIAQLKGAIPYQELNEFRVKDGGVRKIENFTANINGDKATAEADIRKFMKSVRKNGDGDKTWEGVAHYKFTLDKIDGKWKITGEEWNYLPGQGP